MKEKYCPRCRRERPISEWYANKGRYDGLASVCMWCHRRHKTNTRKYHLDRSTEYTLKVRARLRTLIEVDAFDLNEQLREDRLIGDDGRREIERRLELARTLKRLLRGEIALDDEYDRLGIGPVDCARMRERISRRA